MARPSSEQLPCQRPPSTQSRPSLPPQTAELEREVARLQGELQGLEQQVHAAAAEHEAANAAEREARLALRDLKRKQWGTEHALTQLTQQPPPELEAATQADGAEGQQAEILQAGGRRVCVGHEQWFHRSAAIGAGPVPAPHPSLLPALLQCMQVIIDLEQQLRDRQADLEAAQAAEAAARAAHDEKQCVQGAAAACCARTACTCAAPTLLTLLTLLSLLCLPCLLCCRADMKRLADDNQQFLDSFQAETERAAEVYPLPACLGLLSVWLFAGAGASRAQMSCCCPAASRPPGHRV